MKHFFLEIKPVESDKKCDGDFNEQIVRYFTRCADICHKNYSGNMIVTKKTNNNKSNHVFPLFFYLKPDGRKPILEALATSV